MRRGVLIASAPNTIYTTRQLIEMARTTPLESVVEGMIRIGDITLLHGSEGCFKSVFITQLADCIAAGTPFLRAFEVPVPRRVGVMETEIHAVGLGTRLAKMYPDDASVPENIVYFHDQLMRSWRKRRDMQGKFAVIEEWVRANAVEVLMIDTANDFFRHGSNPNEETVAGEFFDLLRNLECKTKVVVRHDRKRHDADAMLSPNERIRGSGEWKEDPEAIFSLDRADRRTHEVRFDCGKTRYGQEPPAMSLWFDQGSFRLTPVPPWVALLEAGPSRRADVLEGFSRFGISARKAADVLKECRSFLIEQQEGHHLVLSLDLAQIERSEPEWIEWVRPSLLAYPEFVPPKECRSAV